MQNSCTPRDHYDRFPETHLLICPSRHEVRDLPQYFCSIVDFFDSKEVRQNDTWFYNLLASPIPQAARIQAYHPPLAKRRRRPNILERLPTEIIHEIIDLVLCETSGGGVSPYQYKSVLALGLSSSILYPKVLAYIDSRHLRTMGPSWAGEQVVYNGGFSYFADTQIASYGLARHPIMHGQRAKHWLWDTVVDGPEDFWYRAIYLVRDYQKEWPEIQQRDWSNIKQDLSQTWRYDLGEVWALRNLTTREYVRSDRIEEPENLGKGSDLSLSRGSRTRKIWNSMMRIVKGDFLHSEDKIPITLAQIFLLMTTFSAEDTVAIREQSLLFQDGPWSGHKFDLVTLGELQSDARSEDSGSWTDVSRIVAADVYHLRWCVRQYRNIWGNRRMWASTDHGFIDSITKTRMENRVWREKRECRVSEA